MKTQKQLKLIAIEAIANSLNLMDIFHTRSSEGLSDEETAKVNEMALEFKASILSKFSGSAAKRSQKLAAKATAKLAKIEEKKVRLEAKDAKKLAKEQAKLVRDTTRAAKLAAKLEKANAKLVPAEVVAA